MLTLWINKLKEDTIIYKTTILINLNPPPRDPVLAVVDVEPLRPREQKFFRLERDRTTRKTQNPFQT